jgi:hypothetical protein
MWSLVVASRITDSAMNHYFYITPTPKVGDYGVGAIRLSFFGAS